MTEAQAKALHQLQQDGTVYAYNGISYSTAKALAARGLATLNILGAQSRYNRRTGHVTVVHDWTLTAAQGAGQ